MHPLTPSLQVASPIPTLSDWTGSASPFVPLQLRDPSGWTLCPTCRFPIISSVAVGWMRSTQEGTHTEHIATPPSFLQRLLCAPPRRLTKVVHFRQQHANPDARPREDLSADSSAAFSERCFFGYRHTGDHTAAPNIQPVIPTGRGHFKRD